MTGRLPNLLIFLAAAAVSSVFFINFCASVFRCGCVSLWNGADAHCNIHMAGARHCPWCASGTVASVIPWVLIVSMQAVVSFRPRPMKVGLRLGMALVAFPLAGALVALGFGLATGYWK